MTLQESIREEIKAGRLNKCWTTGELLSNNIINKNYEESTIRTEPPNHSVSLSNSVNLGNGHNADNNIKYYRVRKRDYGHRAIEYCLPEDRKYCFKEHKKSEKNIYKNQNKKNMISNDSTFNINRNATTINYSEKSKFLECTAEFRQWLLKSLDQFPNEFVHSWVSRGNLMKTGLHKGEKWSCNSLFSAYQQYIWPAKVKGDWDGRFFHETNIYLTKLKESLSISIADGDNIECRNICKKILEWGGVLNRENVAKNIKTDIPIKELSTHLKDTHHFLNNVLKNGVLINNFQDSNGHKLRIDSGTTKIYSLICNGFIIYDGRVASALGYLVSLWWDETHKGEHYSNIPRCLRFSYDNVNKNRKPSLEEMKKILSPLKVDSRRIEENIQVSWLLSTLLEDEAQYKNKRRSKFSFIDESQRLRAIESSLFMIGYDIST